MDLTHPNLPERRLMMPLVLASPLRVPASRPECHLIGIVLTLVWTFRHAVDLHSEVIGKVEVESYAVILGLLPDKIRFWRVSLLE